MGALFVGFAEAEQERGDLAARVGEVVPIQVSRPAHFVLVLLMGTFLAVPVPVLAVVELELEVAVVAVAPELGTALLDLLELQAQMAESPLGGTPLLYPGC